jgi:hypothetical protein
LIVDDDDKELIKADSAAAWVKAGNGVSTAIRPIPSNIRLFTCRHLREPMEAYPIPVRRSNRDFQPVGPVSRYNRKLMNPKGTEHHEGLYFGRFPLSPSRLGGKDFAH